MTNCARCREDSYPYNPTVPTRNRHGGYDQPICRTCLGFKKEEIIDTDIVPSLRREMGLLRGELSYLQRKNKEQRKSYGYKEYTI